MSNLEIYRIADLIARRALGAITPEEELTLDAWIAQSDANRQAYEEIVRRGAPSADAVEGRRVDMEMVRKQIRASVGRRSRRRRRTIGWGAAAAVVAGAVLVFSLGQRTDGAGDMIADIGPGAPFAELILDDGTRIVLDDNSGEKPLGETSSAVRNQDNTLIYDSAETPAEPIYNTMNIPLGSEYNVRLADGTTVHLNSGTRLRYPMTFAGGTREVWLTGEAYFEVAHSDKPFIVHSGKVQVHVLGTSFNVMAYEDEAFMEATLVEGSVRVETGGESVVLTPGKQARIDPRNSSVEVLDVGTATYTAWKDDLFLFDHEPLAAIARKLSRWYDIEIVVESPALAATSFFGKLPKYEGISAILDMMKKTHPFKYEITDDKLIIKDN